MQSAGNRFHSNIDKMNPWYHQQFLEIRQAFSWWRSTVSCQLQLYVENNNVEDSQVYVYFGIQWLEQLGVSPMEFRWH